MRARTSPALLASLVWLAAPVAAPQSYTWVGRDGSSHMTDDLSEVPAEQRTARKRSREIQVVREPERAPSPPEPGHFGHD